MQALNVYWTISGEKRCLANKITFCAYGRFLRFSYRKRLIFFALCNIIPLVCCRLAEALSDELYSGG